MKITFIGAGSTVFVKNVLGDTMLCPALQDAEFALYDIAPQLLTVEAAHTAAGFPITAI